MGVIKMYSQQLGITNFIDLNRNYPDPEDGLHPDGNPYQQETNIFLNTF